ncbi:MAG: hypothetical protein LZF86_110563 [Nitrospira sp.]|nr:MAG: hypothetical protein LZF86_110563 [Nitrospira sp.]
MAVAGGIASRRRLVASGFDMLL